MLVTQTMHICFPVSSLSFSPNTASFLMTKAIKDYPSAHNLINLRWVIMFQADLLF